MTVTKPSASLDTWRDYFRRGDSDIFGIIEHAILVAVADSPEEFKSRRVSITDLLFSCQVSRCTGCDQPYLSTGGDKEANNAPKTVEPVGVDSGGHEEDATKLNVDRIVDEVIRMKDILLNKHDEPSVLFESLTKLTSMSITLDLIKDTEVGKAVNSLRKHGSDKISKLAKTLIVKWKEMVDQKMNLMPKEAAGADGTPEFETLSIVDEVENFPSVPYDLELYPSEPTAFELSQILDSLDNDGNPLDSVEPKHERKVRSGMMKMPNGICEANVMGRDKKNQQMKKKEANVPMRHSAPVLDEPRRKPKQNKEQMVHDNQRKPSDVADQKRKLSGSQQDKREALAQEAKFENAKRRLQESYQQHEKAKRKRTIQVLETIPNQRKAQRPLVKRPMRR